MDYDFGVMWSDVTDGKVLAMEMGVGPNGSPVFRVSLFDGKKWSGARYHDFGAALATYKLLKRVIN